MKVSKSGDRATEEKDSIMSVVVSFFTSVRTTIFLLLALAVASVLGTIIPQEITPDQLSHVQDSMYSRLLMIFDLHGVYRSWWFVLLLVLLCLNIVGCLSRRAYAIPGEWRGRAGRDNFIFSVSDSRPVSSIKTALVPLVDQVMKTSALETVEEGETRLEWTRHRVHLLGFPLIHVAIIVVLVGALVGLMYGFKGSIQIREGNASDRYFLMPSGQPAVLPFEIAVDQFVLLRYPTGEPKEYRSDVRLIKNGAEVYKGAIRVNHPVSYGGISLFQSDYKLLGVRTVSIGLRSPDGEKTVLHLVPHQTSQLQPSGHKVKLLALDPGSTIRGPWVDVSFEKEAEDSKNVRLFKKGSQPVRVGDYELQFLDYQPLYATGLQIGYDPGAPLVYLGCIMLMAGFVLSIFTNHRRITVLLVPESREKTLVRVSGSSRRMRREFRETIEGTIRQNFKAG
jgi:cytochrome c biogenesis protein